MVLADLRKQLEQAGSISLKQLAANAELPVDAMVELLQPWLRRGRLQMVKPPPPACGSGCGKCGSVSSCDNDEVVQWLG